jgi:S1-C subfamily serine protease
MKDRFTVFLGAMIVALLATSSSSDANESSEYAIRTKLRMIVFERIRFTDASLPEICEFFTSQSRTLDPENVGVIVQYDPSIPSNNRNLVTLSAADIPMRDALEMVSRILNATTEITNRGVLISSNTASESNLITKQYDGIGKDFFGFIKTTPRNSQCRSFLESNGIDFPPSSKVDFNPERNRLTITNTQEGLELVDTLVDQYLATQPTDPEDPPPASDNYVDSIVTIAGPNSRGTGFIASWKGEAVVFTNQHVISAMAEPKIETVGGIQITPLSIEYADNADIALIRIKPFRASPKPLEIATRADRISFRGDETMIPGDSLGGSVVTKTEGKVLALGPNQIEVSNPVYQGNSGSPIIHTDSGKVIGVLTYAEKLSFDEFSRESFNNPDSAIKSKVRYFGHRIDTVNEWQKVNRHLCLRIDQVINESRDDLLAIESWFYDSPDYQDFEKLHKLWNSTLRQIDRPNLALSSIQNEYDSFLRGLDYLIRSSSTRVDEELKKMKMRGLRYQLTYLQERDHATNTQIAEALQRWNVGLKKDSDLFFDLIKNRRNR